MARKALVVRNSEGHDFYVKILEPGDTYGLNAVWGDRQRDRIGVTFYDFEYAHTNGFGAEGQSTGATYYLGTLIHHHYGQGLTLHGGVDKWSLDGETMKRVLDFIVAFVAAERESQKEELSKS